MSKRLLAILIVMSFLTQTVFAYSGASSWATKELDQANAYGLITDKIEGNMKAPITREEFAEVAVRLYEISTGKEVAFDAADSFADTKNQEILKAYHLKIVNGTDMGKRLFSPNQLTNREQVAAMLYRTLEAIKPGESFVVSGNPDYSDGNIVSSYAVEALKFMSKNDLLKGSNGKIDPKGTCTREMAVIIAFRILQRLEGNGFANPQSNGTTNSQSSSFHPEWLVINDFPVLREDYRYIKGGEYDYIFVNYEKLKYALKIPYNGFYSYPDVEKNGDLISFSWTSSETEEIFLIVEMRLGSKEVFLNREGYSAEFAPIEEGNKVFVDISSFMALLGLEFADESTEELVLIQYSENFPVELLYGTWSDVDGGFLGFKDIVTGVVSLSSFASSYTFNEDGTYAIIMVNVGGFTDKLVRETGKYTVIGNTIMYYDILETLYEGEPFQLVYEDKALAKPSFDFIDNFDQNGPKILISEWLNKQVE